MQAKKYSFSEKRPDSTWKGYEALQEGSPALFSEFDIKCKRMAESLLAVYEESPKEISHSDKSPDEKVKSIIAKMDREKFGNADQRKAFTSMISYLNSLDTAEARKVIKHLGDAMTGYTGEGEKKDDKDEDKKNEKEEKKESTRKSVTGWKKFVEKQKKQAQSVREFRSRYSNGKPGKIQEKYGFNLRDVLNGAVEALLWADAWTVEDGEMEQAEDAHHQYDIRDFSSRDQRQIKSDVVSFLKDIEKELTPEQISYLRSELRDDYIGHNFHLTRNGHGAGFWDRGLGEVGRILTDLAKTYGNISAFIDDNGKIELE